MIRNPFRRRRAVDDCCEVEVLATSGKAGEAASGLLRVGDTSVMYVGVVIDPRMDDEMYDRYERVLDSAERVIHEGIRSADLDKGKNGGD